MSKYIIDVGDAYTKHICGKGDMLCLPVRINEFEDNWLNTDIPLTPYTEPNMKKVREEAYEDGYKTAKVQCNIQAEKDLREVGDRHYQKGYQDATVKISSDEQAIAEKAYQSGLKDAWETVKKLARMDTDTSESITGYFGLHNIMHNLTASEAIEKIRQYEQKNEEIQVGDEVIYDGKRCVVVFPQTEHLRATIIDCGRFHHAHIVEYDELKKTGRHFTELVEALKKMRETE